MTEIWFIRHGETDWNVARRMQGWQDIDLNDTGRVQAGLLAARLARDAATTPFDALYSSDLARARDTAQAVSEQLALRLRIEPGVRERSFGVLEGIDLEKIDALQPEAAAAWKSRDPQRPLAGGESLGQFRNRVISAVEDVANRHHGERVLLFTHGGVLDIVWRHASGLPLEAPREVELRNVGINRVVVAADGWRIAGWGDVAHTEAEVAARDDASVLGR